MTEHTKHLPGIVGRPGGGEMFDVVAPGYDRLNRITSFWQDRRWRRRLVAGLGELAQGDRVLDVATGTADVALSIVDTHPSVSVDGLDPSGEMLALGREKAARAEVADRVTLVQGDAQALPYADESFAAAVVSFGIRNIPDRTLALREMARVTRPGGTVAVLELTEPRGTLLAPFARLHIRKIVPWLGRRLSRGAPYEYLQQSIAAFPTPAEFMAEMTDAGLQDVRAKRMSLGAVHLFLGTV